MAVADGLNIETKSPDVMFASEATKSQAFLIIRSKLHPKCRIIRSSLHGLLFNCPDLGRNPV